MCIFICIFLTHFKRYSVSFKYLRLKPIAIEWGKKCEDKEGMVHPLWFWRSNNRTGLMRTLFHAPITLGSMALCYLCTPRKGPCCQGALSFTASPLSYLQGKLWKGTIPNPAGRPLQKYLSCFFSLLFWVSSTSWTFWVCSASSSAVKVSNFHSSYFSCNFPIIETVFVLFSYCPHTSSLFSRWFSIS